MESYHEQKPGRKENNQKRTGENAKGKEGGKKDKEGREKTQAIGRPIGNCAHALFDTRDVIYFDQSDKYLLPPCQRASGRFRTVDNGIAINTYWSSSCPGCAMKVRYRTDDHRRYGK